ncbi:MAG: HAD family hydrolase [Gammaproteobacteria bacterium]|nr:HAD family hydrolase [Gammaproteobacteria bacterium]
MSIVTRILSFDLDDTLWPVAPVIEAAERELYEWLRERHPRAVAEHTIESMRALRTAVAARHPDRSHDLSFLRLRALALQLAEAGYEEGEAERAFEVFYAARNRVDCYADVHPALALLAARGPLYALSNGNADLGLCGLARYFSGHLSARSVGAAKPDPRIFAALAHRAGAHAAQIVHVGDDPYADVEGARRAGLQAVWINRHARPWPADLAPPEREIRGLDELC